MDNKLKALHELYNYAVSHNLCANKKEFARLVGVANSNLSKAFGSDEKYLTDKFIVRVNTALGNKFNPAWLFFGTGSMLNSQVGNCAEGDNSMQNINGNQNQNGVPHTTIERLLDELKAQREENAKEREQNAKEREQNAKEREQNAKEREQNAKEREQNAKERERLLVLIDKLSNK